MVKRTRFCVAHAEHPLARLIPIGHAADTFTLCGLCGQGVPRALPNDGALVLTHHVHHGGEHDRRRVGALRAFTGCAYQTRPACSNATLNQEQEKPVTAQAITLGNEEAFILPQVSDAGHQLRATTRVEGDAVLAIHNALAAANACLLVPSANGHTLVIRMALDGGALRVKTRPRLRLLVGRNAYIGNGPFFHTTLRGLHDF
jgi:hypothetical protein